MVHESAAMVKKILKKRRGTLLGGYKLDTECIAHHAICQTNMHVAAIQILCKDRRTKCFMNQLQCFQNIKKETRERLLGGCELHTVDA